MLKKFSIEECETESTAQINQIQLSHDFLNPVDGVIITNCANKLGQEMEEENVSHSFENMDLQLLWQWLNETENYDDDEYEYYGSDPGENHKGSEGEDDYGNITKVLTL